MTSFVIYLLICTNILCTDFGPGFAIKFKTKEACVAKASSVMALTLDRLKQRDILVVDYIAICLTLGGQEI